MTRGEVRSRPLPVQVRKARQSMLGAAVLVIVVALAQVVSPTGARSAQAAGLTCGAVQLSEPARNFIHGCSGKGTVQYTLACYTSNTVRSYGWNTGGQNRIFSARCTNGATAWKVTYKIIR